MSYAVETLVTDTICYEVIAQTAKTITVRRMKAGEVVRTEGDYLPVVYKKAVSDPYGFTQTVRLRKDGTYRISEGLNPLRLTETTPTFRTDYSF